MSKDIPKVIEWTSRIVGHERVRADQLLAHPLNHRVHPIKQRQVVAASISELGFVKSILVNKTTGRIIDGHERAMQALACGDGTMVDVEYVELSEEEERKALLILDASSELAAVDGEALQLLIDGMQMADNALQGLLDDMAKAAKIGAEPIVEEPIEQVAAPVVKLGQVWILGSHRLMCGDSTDPKNTERLFAGNKIACVCTDPPYGIGSLMHGGTWAKKQDAQFEMMRQWDATTCQGFFDQVVALNVPAVVWGGNYFATPPSRCWLAWDKPEFPSMSDVELAWTNIDANAKRIECSRTHQVDGDKEHATQKPIAVMMWSLGFLPAGIVYDPFAGSGTTILAADKLNKACYAMELEPAYCDIVIDRWQRQTGQQAVLETEAILDDGPKPKPEKSTKKKTSKTSRRVEGC